jgi:hypothetical protein
MMNSFEFDDAFFEDQEQADEYEIRRYMDHIKAGHPLTLTSLLEPGNRQANPQTSCKGSN